LGRVRGHFIKFENPREHLDNLLSQRPMLKTLGFRIITSLHIDHTCKCGGCTIHPEWLSRV